MHVDTEKVKQRVHGRNTAKSVLGLVDLDSIESKKAFIQELREQLLPEVVKQEKSERSLKAAEVLTTRMPFGIHAGETLENVPEDYLRWYLQETEEFTPKVAKCLELLKEDQEEDE